MLPLDVYDLHNLARGHLIGHCRSARDGKLVSYLAKRFWQGCKGAGCFRRCADCYLTHLRANAATLNLDPARITVSGSSAGAHLAALATLTLPTAERPAALVLLSGIYDLRPLVGTYINDALRMDQAEAMENSPALHDVTGFPRTLIAWGEHETDEFKRQSRYFGHLLSQAETPLRMLEVAGRNHFDIVHDLTEETALARAIAGL